MSEFVNNQKINHSEKKVYRYNFRNEFVAILFRFSKVHQYDSSEDFKEAFEKWEITHETEIKNESDYLQSIGYIGDFRTKAYKSARYYFRKKSYCELYGIDILDTTEIKSVVPYTSSTKRKKYTSIDFDLSTKIIDYLEIYHFYKPSEGFSNFCEINRKAVDDEVLRLEEEGENGILKIKKTFKNKHFNKKRELLQEINEKNN
jgi:hypothetical protein